MASNRWGNGDIFSRAIDGDEAPTEKFYPHQRIEVGVPRTRFRSIFQGMWKIIGFGVTLIILLMVCAALVGAVLGVVMGIMEVV